MKKILIIFVLLFIFNVKALNVDLITSSGIELNEKVELQLLFNGDGSNKYDSGLIELNYDSNLFDFDSYSYYSSSMNVSSSAVDTNKLKLNFNYKNNSTAILKIYLIPKKDNVSGEFSINVITENETKSCTKTVEVYDADLQNLSTSIGTLSPVFQSNITYYTLTVDSSYISIYSKVKDSTSSSNKPEIDTIDLNYGSNIYSIIVTSKNGYKKTYTININRTDTRNSNSELKNISISNGEINFSSDKYDYDIVLSENESTLDISAISMSNKAKINYLNGKSITLEKGESGSLIIEVTSEKGTTSTYKLNISRSDVITNNIEHNGTTSNESTTNNNNVDTTKEDNTLNLKSLSISNIDFTFNKNVTNYILKIDNKYTSVDINYQLYNKKSKAQIVGSTNLKEGENELKIIVTNDKKEKIYNITIIRTNYVPISINDDVQIINALKDKTISNTVKVKVDSNNNEIKLSKLLLQEIKSSNKSIIYEMYQNEICNYRIVINPDQINNYDDTVLSIVNNTDNNNIKEIYKDNNYYPFSFILEGNGLNSILVEDYRKDVDSNYKLYSYNDGVLKEIEYVYNEEYISYMVNSFNNTYILMQDKKQDKINETKKENKSLLLIIVTVILISISFLVIKYNNKDINKQNV